MRNDLDPDTDETNGNADVSSKPDPLAKDAPQENDE